MVSTCGTHPSGWSPPEYVLRCGAGNFNTWLSNSNPSNCVCACASLGIDSDSDSRMVDMDSDSRIIACNVCPPRYKRAVGPPLGRSICAHVCILHSTVDAVGWSHVSRIVNVRYALLMVYVRRTERAFPYPVVMSTVAVAPLGPLSNRSTILALPNRCCDSPSKLRVLCPKLVV